MINDIKRRLRAYLNRHNAVILTYHSVLPEPQPFPIWHNLALHKFEQQISFLARRFRCVPLSELMRDLARGRVHPYTVAVTFDDGFRSNLTHVLPVLKQYQVPATLFVTTGFIGGDNLLWTEILACAVALCKAPAIKYAEQELPLRSVFDRVSTYRTLVRTFKQYPPAELTARVDELLCAAALTRNDIAQSAMCQSFSSLTWDEVETLRISGLFEFGAHTINHWRLTNLAPAEALNQIAESKRQLEAHVGGINYFAYPHGGTADFNESHRNIAIEAGYEAVFTAMTGIVNSQSDRFALPRCGIGEEITIEQFDYILHGGAANL